MSYRATVLVSLYNSYKYIKHKIRNMNDQTIFDQCEIVFINGGSPQKERKVVLPFVKENKNCIYLESRKRITIYDAWNRGIKATTAPLICNSNSDDVLAPNAVERLCEALESSDAAAAFPNIYTTTDPNTNWGDVTTGYINTSCEAVIGPFAMWRRKLHAKYGLYNPELWVFGDADWWNKLRKGKENFVKVKGYLVTYLVGHGMERQIAPDGESYRIKDARLLNLPRGSVEGW